MGDATSFFWVTNKLTQPHFHQRLRHYGRLWLVQNRLWSGGVLREFIREGRAT
ncbi:hypothetical protein O9929_22750 [Vibrio lentus]|nr:hypothetical protein [Vibrio lentus]